MARETVTLSKREQWAQHIADAPKNRIDLHGVIVLAEFWAIQLDKIAKDQEIDPLDGVESMNRILFYILTADETGLGWQHARNYLRNTLSPEEKKTYRTCRRTAQRWYNDPVTFRAAEAQMMTELIMREFALGTNWK